MTTTERDGMATLDAFLAEARDQEAAPSDAFLARVLADAESVAQEQEAPAARAHLVPPRRGWLWALGGWPALGSLAASAVLGLGLGLAQPSALAVLPSLFVGEAVSVAIGTDDDPLGLLEG